MTIKLIPQDELTLNLLAEVLAKMYQYSLARSSDAPVKVAESAADLSIPDSREQRQDSVEKR